MYKKIGISLFLAAFLMPASVFAAEQSCPLAIKETSAYPQLAAAPARNVTCVEKKRCRVMTEGQDEPTYYSGCIVVTSQQGRSCKSRCKNSCKARLVGVQTQAN